MDQTRPVRSRHWTPVARRDSKAWPRHQRVIGRALTDLCAVARGTVEGGRVESLGGIRTGNHLFPHARKISPFWKIVNPYLLTKTYGINRQKAPIR